MEAVALLLYSTVLAARLRSLPCMSRELNWMIRLLRWGRGAGPAALAFDEHPRPLGRRREGRRYARGWSLRTQQSWFHGGDHGNMPLSEICIPNPHASTLCTLGACNCLNARRELALAMTGGSRISQSPSGIILDGMVQVSAALAQPA